MSCHFQQANYPDRLRPQMSANEGQEIWLIEPTRLRGYASISIPARFSPNSAAGSPIARKARTRDGRGAARLSRGEPAACLCRTRVHHAPDRIADRQGAVSAGGLSRGCLAADRPYLWPWRRRRRHGRRMARQSRSVADHDQRRPRLWPRHGRQQGAAQHQSRGIARGARDPRRQARLQRQIHHRDRRGDRLARSAAGLRSPCATS